MTGRFEWLSKPSLRRPLIVCVTLMGVQQLSGINNAFNYSSAFLSANGLSDDDVRWVAIAMNAANVLIVLLSTVMMDRIGRRALLFASMVGMLLAVTVLTVAILCGAVPLVCASVVAFVASFGLGLGPVVWLLPAELFPMDKRAPATATVTAVNWLANWLVAQTFPLVAAALGPFAFVPCGAVLAGAMVFAWFAVPETRGHSLEQIEAMMRDE